MLKRIVSFSLLVCAVFMLCLGGCAQSQSAPAIPTHISYLSDKYFNTWYEKTKAELEALVG